MRTVLMLQKREYLQKQVEAFKMCIGRKTLS